MICGVKDLRSAALRSDNSCVKRRMEHGARGGEQKGLHYRTTDYETTGRREENTEHRTPNAE